MGETRSLDERRKGSKVGMNYAVIENTPGYLPEDDDPPVFDQYQEALNYLIERRNELWEDESNYTWPPEHLDDGFSHTFELEVHEIEEGMFTYYDLRKTHDLGRIVQIVPLEAE